MSSTSEPQFSRRTLLAATGGGLTLAGLPVLPATVTHADDDVWVGLEARAAALDPPVHLLETVVPGTFAARGGVLSITGELAKVGTHSLRWEHPGGDVLTVSGPVRWRPVGYEEGDDQTSMGAVGTFAFWVHNDTPTTDQLRVEFGRAGRTDTHFTFGLDFTGWRTAWVRFGYDTTGAPHPDMDEVRFVAPGRSGVLHLDQIVINSERRPDHPTPDRQVPFVQPDIGSLDNKHWMALLPFSEELAAHPLPTPTVTPRLRADLQVLRDRHLAHLRGGPAVTDATVAEQTRQVGAFGVPGLLGVDGVPRPNGPGLMVDGYQTAILPDTIKADVVAAVTPLRKCTDLMFQLARSYEQARTAGDVRAEALGVLWLRCFVHLREQGFADGSAQGTIHHIGYQHRGFFDSLVLVRPLLEQVGLWEAARADLAWYVGLGRLCQDFSDAADRGGLVDVLNTLLLGLLSAALLMPQEDDQIAYLMALTRWCDGAHQFSPGLEGGFKPDGSTFHHMGMYADYGRDGFQGSVPVVALLAGTAYELSTEARAVQRRSLLLLRTHANTLQWPIGLSGRHPTGLTALNVNTFGQLAVAPLPGGAGPVDPEVGAAFLRLLPAKPTAVQQRLAETLRASGVIAEDSPHGHWSVNHGSVGLHRRDDWLVTVKGHHRYHWATEIYDKENCYGRYIAYGQIQVQSRADSTGVITNAAGGFVQPGWDWNRFPGTTTKHLAYDELKAGLGGNIQQLLLTESPFGGGGSFRGEHGVFGLDLREHPMFDASHRARSSVFCFDNRVIALGTGIGNDDPDHRTETTLFQTVLVEGLDVHWDSKRGELSGTKTDLTEQLEGRRVLVDPVGHAYVVPAGQRLVQQRRQQTAPDQSGTTEATQPVAVAVLDHGRAPTGGRYEYALVVDAGRDGGLAFAEELAGEQPPYRVLRQDDVAHVVADRDTGVVGYVCFARTTCLPSTGPLREVSRASLVMVRETDTELAVSVTDPDLHLYQGKDRDQYDGHTFVGGQSPYSRPWRWNASEPSTVVVRVSGVWRLADPHDGVLVAAARNETVLRVRCVDGLPTEFDLLAD